MIGRMVDILSGMIKPASPSQQTMDLIDGNARNWGHTTCLILMEHYQQNLEDFLGDLGEGPTPDWKEAFQVASRWALRNLPRITRDVLDHAQALIATRLDGPGPPRDEGSQVGAVRTQDTVTTSSPIPATQPRPDRSPKQRGPVTRVSVATDTGQDGEWFRGVPDRDCPLEQRDPRLSRRPADTICTDEGPHQQSQGLPHCQEQELLSDLGSGPQAERDPDTLSWRGRDSPLVVLERTASQLELERLFDDLQEEEEAMEAEAQKAQQTAGASQTPAQPLNERDEEDEELLEQLFPYSGPPTTFQVNRHRTTPNKMVDWNLHVTKKWLFLGDSNLGRFPSFTLQNLQVESYPGANFRHAESVIRRATVQPDLVVEKVLLSFGINSRKNKPKETTIRNLQAAIRALKARFPYTQYWIALVNFSPSLNLTEQENLLILNHHVHKNMPYVPILADTLFHTEVDNIHWTEDTARDIFNHWAYHLNLQAP